MMVRGGPTQPWLPDFSQAYWRFEADWWWFTGRRHLVSRLSRKRLGSRARVLELGCGSGINGRIFAQGLDYTGVDVSLPSLKHGGAQGAGGLCLATLDYLPFASNSFHLVLLLDVLEHLEREGPALDEAYRVLREGGEALVLSPAHMFLWGSHDIANGHKRRYSAEQLHGLLASHGFQVEKLGYWNFSGFFAVALMRWRDRRQGLGRKPTGDFQELPHILNRLLSHVLETENRLIAQGFCLPTGTSLIALARKVARRPDRPDAEASGETARATQA